MQPQHIAVFGSQIEEGDALGTHALKSHLQRYFFVSITDSLHHGRIFVTHTTDENETGHPSGKLALEQNRSDRCPRASNLSSSSASLPSWQPAVVSKKKKLLLWSRLSRIPLARSSKTSAERAISPVPQLSPHRDHQACGGQLIC